MPRNPYDNSYYKQPDGDPAGMGWCCLACVAAPFVLVLVVVALAAVGIMWERSIGGKIMVILGLLVVATVIWAYVTDE